MKLLFTVPANNPPHGGFRTIYALVRHLTKQGHEVAIYSIKKDDAPTWAEFSVPVTFQTEYDPSGFDCLVICSPHSIDFADRSDCPPRVVLFCQMREDLFKPLDAKWKETCQKFYRSPHPVIVGSRWIGEDVAAIKPGGTKNIFYIPTAVDTSEFPIAPGLDDGKTVLVEGWESYNDAKDVRNIAPKVALRLKAEGYRIVAYSFRPLKTLPEAVDEYYLCPPIEKINELYSRATILLKASQYDSRACAPMEAMTKGCPTVRAIIKGDDDLTEDNSLRVPYKEEPLYAAAKSVLTNRCLRETLSRGCLEHVQRFTWDRFTPLYEEIFLREPPAPAKTVIVSVVYRESSWAKTKECIEATGAPVVYVERNPPGIGSLAEALNRGFQQAVRTHPKAEYIWFVTNVTFKPNILPKLEARLEANPTFAAVHAAFASDHAFCRPGAGKGLSAVPFVEFTAPIVRKDVFSKNLLDGAMPYVGHDCDWGYRVRQGSYLVGVDYDLELGHTYIRHSGMVYDTTRKRAERRRAAVEPTTRALKKKYGSDWRGVLQLKGYSV